MTSLPLRTALLAAALTAAAALPTAASAAPATAGIVAADGTTPGGQAFAGLVQSLPDGAFGSATFTPAGGAPQDAEVVCARIKGERAAVGVQLADGRYVTVAVQDLGFAPDAPQDRLRVTHVTTAPPTCASVPALSARDRIASGDVTVASDPV